MSKHLRKDFTLEDFDSVTKLINAVIMALWIKTDLTEESFTQMMHQQGLRPQTELIFLNGILNKDDD